MEIVYIYFRNITKKRKRDSFIKNFNVRNSFPKYSKQIYYLIY